jgi:hypothetical protein
MLDAFSRWPRLEAMDAMEAITPLVRLVWLSHNFAVGLITAE